MHIPEALLTVGPLLASAVVVVAAGLASIHAVLYKRDARAAVAWVGLILLVPAFGAILYALFGINRIRRKARALRRRYDERARLGRPRVDERAPGLIAPLVHLVDGLGELGLTSGNRIELLENGDDAFPRMLAAIDGAKDHVHLSTYIFDRDEAGVRFADALGRARARGVAVRVLIDAVGARYSFPSVLSTLKKQGVSTARFMPSWVPWFFPYLNLRNHRKLLIVDGTVGFTGGLNIRHGNLLAEDPKHPIRDLHLEATGPVVAQLQEAFIEDWSFSTRETLSGDRYFPALDEAGPVSARAVLDGPDEDFEVLRHVLLGALSVATTRVEIMTPYFVPDSALITALGVAAMRGVEVHIVLPEENNLNLVQWASTATLWQVLERGCRVFMSRGVFDHTKLMVVDGRWTLLGSANWDARSLRLNFELNLECYDDELAARASALLAARRRDAREVTLDDVNARSLPVRVRDGVARLFAPYL